MVVTSIPLLLIVISLAQYSFRTYRGLNFPIQTDQSQLMSRDKYVLHYDPRQDSNLRMSSNALSSSFYKLNFSTPDIHLESCMGKASSYVVSAKRRVTSYQQSVELRRFLSIAGAPEVSGFLLIPVNVLSEESSVYTEDRCCYGSDHGPSSQRYTLLCARTFGQAVGQLLSRPL